MKKLVIILFLLQFYRINAQNLDSLYNSLIHNRGIKTEFIPQVFENASEPVKCNFSLVSTIKVNYNKFSPKQKAILSTMLFRPQMDTSIVTPSGKFRIHYNKTGINAPGYALNELAQAIDSAYNYEVNILKYPPPPKDGFSGGDDKYDFYIQNLGGSEYASTYPDQQLTNQTFTNYVIMDNDFGPSYNTHGIDAARATVAHELHHAIQMGNYVFRESDTFFHESTSTAMEEFVFDKVNDYYFYIENYFRNTAKTLTNYSGYNFAIWSIFLKDNFGVDIIKRIWEEMKTKRAAEAFSVALAEKGTTFKDAFNLFALWCYYTDTRAVPGKYFEEAAQYPAKIVALMSTPFSKPNTTVKVASEPASNCYLEFLNGESILTAIITNGDVQSSISSFPQKNYFDYALSSNSSNGFRKLTDGYYSKISGDNLTPLLERDILNDIPLNEGPMPIETTNYAYPQPFSYSKHSFLKLPASLSGSLLAEVNIYSTDMNLVFSSEKKIVGSDKIVVIWNGLDNSGNKLPTGVYLYIIKCGEEILKGKLVIYNE